MKRLAKINGFELAQESDDFYMVVMPNGDTLVNLMGTKDEVISELIRWKEEVDMNNSFMLEVENLFIEVLKEA